MGIHFDFSLLPGMFEGDELDLSKWNILRWRPGWVNNEEQAYTNRDTNIFFLLQAVSQTRGVALNMIENDT